MLPKFVEKWALSDTALQSLVKAISWQVTGSIDTFVISWLITGQVLLASGIAFTEIITKVFLFWAHERVWNKIAWGIDLVDKK